MLSQCARHVDTSTVDSTRQVLNENPVCKLFTVKLCNAACGMSQSSFLRLIQLCHSHTPEYAMASRRFLGLVTRRASQGCVAQWALWQPALTDLRVSPVIDTCNMVHVAAPLQGAQWLTLAKLLLAHTTHMIGALPQQRLGLRALERATCTLDSKRRGEHGQP